VHPAMTQRLLNIDRIRCDFPSIETPERLSWRETEILRLVATAEASQAREYRLRLKKPAPTLSPSLGGPLYLNPQPVSFLATLALPGLLPRVALLALRFRLEKYAQHTFSTETERRKNSAAPKASPLCCGSQNQLTKIG
jgi:hypothetical protein